MMSERTLHLISESILKFHGFSEVRSQCELYVEYLLILVSELFSLSSFHGSLPTISYLYAMSGKLLPIFFRSRSFSSTDYNSESFVIFLRTLVANVQRSPLLSEYNSKKQWSTIYKFFVAIFKHEQNFVGHPLLRVDRLYSFADVSKEMQCKVLVIIILALSESNNSGLSLVVNRLQVQLSLIRDLCSTLESAGETYLDVIFLALTNLIGTDSSKYTLFGKHIV